MAVDHSVKKCQWYVSMPVNGLVSSGRPNGQKAAAWPTQSEKYARIDSDNGTFVDQW
jgi:hypothetical protein